MRGTFSVAHAGRLHLMQPKGEMLAKAKGSVLKERRTGGAGSEEDVQSLVKKWEYTSFKSLPREERWELLTDLQRRSKELREEWKTKIKTMNSQALKRKVDSQDDDITSAKNKALKFQKYQIVPITSISALEALTATYRGIQRQWPRQEVRAAAARPAPSPPALLRVEEEHVAEVR